MNTYIFYKSIYDRELNRRKDLDNSINTPITILTLIVGVNSIYIEKSLVANFLKEFGIVEIVYIFLSCSIILSIFFLTKSYNNLFKGFDYRNLALTSEIRKFETIDIPKYNEKVYKCDNISFELELVNRLVSVTDNHIIFNDKRSLDLYKSKTCIIISLIVTGIQIIIITFN